MLVEPGLREDKLNDCPLPIQVLPPWPLDEFLSKQGVVLSRNDDRRRYARLYYRKPASLALTTSLPAFVRPDQEVSTYSCDLSRSGIAFLSACELYPREIVMLQVTELGWRQLRVVRCRRLASRCFEIGAEFVLSPCPLPKSCFCGTSTK